MYYSPMKRTKRITQAIEFWSVRALIAMIGIVPLGVLRGAGASLGWIAFNLIRIRRRVALANIRRALGPRPSDAEIAKIGLRSYQNMGRSLVEFASFGKLSADKVASMVEFEGTHHFDDVLAAGTGAIVFAGHFDNWELLGAATARHGYPVHFLVGEQSNKRVDALMNDLRRAQGIGIISREAALKRVLRELSRNQIIAMLPDQNAGRTGVFVDFFGKPASTYRGPATFALKHGCPVIPAFIIRRPGRPHRAVIERPIWPDREAEKEEAVQKLTQECTNVLMEYIRRYPDHYFWVHRRWKTQPPADT